MLNFRGVSVKPSTIYITIVVLFFSMDFGGVFVGGWQILVVLFVNRQPCQGLQNGWPVRVWICSWPTRSCGVDIL